MKKTIALMFAVCVAAAVVVAAGKEPKKDSPPDVEALILKGLKAYKEGKSQDAIQALQQAIVGIQRAQQQGLAAFFPAAPAGWEAGKIESGSIGAVTDDKGGTFSAINLSRRYTQKGKGQDDEKMTVTITVHSQKELVEAQKGMAEAYKNPEFVAAMNAAGKVKFAPVDKDGWTGLKIVDTEGRKAEALAFCGDLMLQVQVSKPDEKVLETFWSAIDLKGLAGAATPKVEKPAGSSR